MIAVCDKHSINPVKGYSCCPGCEVESLREESERQRAALVLCVESLRGYRREMNDSQPCDAENNALMILTANAVLSGKPPRTEL
jgi:hypothetical protein